MIGDGHVDEVAAGPRESDDAAATVTVGDAALDQTGSLEPVEPLRHGTRGHHRLLHQLAGSQLVRGTRASQRGEDVEVALPEPVRVVDPHELGGQRERHPVEAADDEDRARVELGPLRRPLVDDMLHVVWGPLHEPEYIFPGRYFNIGVFYALLFLAAYRLPSGMGATLVATAPMVTMTVAWLVLRERPARVSLAAGVVGLFGVGMLMMQNGLDGPLDPVGLAAGMLAVVSSSVGFVLTKRWAPQADVVTATSWQLVAGGLVLLPLGLVVEGALPALDLPAVGALAYLGLLGSGVAYVLWFRGLSLLGPTSASIIGLVNPVVGVLLGVVLLGENFGPVHLVAMVLIVASVLAAQPPVRAWLTRQSSGHLDTPHHVLPGHALAGETTRAG